MFRFSYNKILKVLSILILLVLTACLVSFITLLVSGVKPVLINAFTESSDSEGLPSRLEKTPDYGQAYINSIVFLGDSTIASISATELLSETFGPYQVWTGQDGELPLDYNTSTSNIIFPETQKQISVSSATERETPYLRLTSSFVVSISTKQYSISSIL